MISEPTWKVEYKKELDLALQARSNGNEGMARVCARRAAGIVIVEYLQRHGHTHINSNVYDRIALFCASPEVDDRYKEVTRHFLRKVNIDHNLPVNTDLIHNAEWLKESLLDDRQD